MERRNYFEETASARPTNISFGSTGAVFLFYNFFIDS
jgi:hypothetical protein